VGDDVAVPHSLPPRGVLRAFDVQDRAPEWLAGGQGGAWRAGSTVLKPLDMSMAALEWQADLLGEIDGHADIRVAPPVRTSDGRLVVDGWTGWRYEPGIRPAARWLEVVAAGRAFHQAVRRPRPSFLEERTDPWGVADRVAWGETPSGRAAELPHLASVFAALRPVRAESQLVHADLTGNVHLHQGLPPLVIDLSMYWRPTAFASAVVVVDALLFEGAGTELVDAVAAGEGPEFAQCLLRALIFRATTDHGLRPADVAVQNATFGPTARILLEHLGPSCLSAY
jgi:uncharacterized protein (TIGR02569 family)